tara:strand:- start:1367 stop:3295 length:1929 start_codon:yes stop_codon:yes gene_type:complete
MGDKFFNKYVGTLDTEYYIPASAYASHTNPMTANQIAEATQKLNAGVSGLDISMVDPAVFETIPTEHFKEIGRLTKLTGAEVDLHGPIQDTDLGGFDDKNKVWNEQKRQEVERRMKDVLDKGHLLDPKGNIPVNFHSTGGMPGTTWRKLEEKDLKHLVDPREIKEIKKHNMRVEDTMGIINQDTGEPNVIRFDTRKGFKGEEEIWTPKVRLKSMNQTQWEKQTLLPLFEMEKSKSEVQDRIEPELRRLDLLRDKIEKVGMGRLSEDEKREIATRKNNLDLLDSHISEIDSNIITSLKDINDHLLRFVPKDLSDEEKDRLKTFKKLTTELDQKNPNRYAPSIYQEAQKRYGKTEKAIMETEKALEPIKEEYEQDINKVMASLPKMPTPEIFKEADEFSKGKVAESVANAAFYAYDKYKDKSPTLVIENVYPEWTLSRAETLKETIEEGRKRFAKKLNKEKNVSMDKAKQLASKFIGVTWDVGHINMLRKQGFTEQEIVEEAKKIAPLVKQVHLTDNFGFNDTHLPIGMGNVPVEAQLKELQKQGFKIEKGRLVHEVGGWLQHFKTDPHVEALGNFDTPLYSTQADPKWSYIRDTEGVYRYGFGDILPDMHFREVYGGGFASLPKELGGQVGGDKSRFGGTPNE